MQSEGVEIQSSRLAEALRAAHAAGFGVPADLQEIVRDFARSWRVAGGEIGPLLVETKRLVRETTGTHEPVFTPKVVGWTIAGYFDGTTKKS